MKLALDWPVKRPRLMLSLALAATLVSVALMVFRLKPETSLQGLLDKSDPAVAAMSMVLDRFPVVNELLLFVSMPDAFRYPGREEPAWPGLVQFAEHFKSAVEHDAEASQLITHVRYRVESNSRDFVEKVMAPAGLYYLYDAQVAELKQRLTPAGMDEQLARDVAMLSAPGPAAGALAKTLSRDPLRLNEFLLQRIDRLSLPGATASSLGDGAFLSPDGKGLLIRISGAQSAGDFRFAQRLVAAVQRIADATSTERVKIDIAGAYAMAAHSATRIRSDSISDIVSTIVGLAVLFLIACRRPIRLFAFAFFPVAAGMLWGFGAYAILMPTITPLAAVVGGTLGAIGLDYSIHYITHYQELRRASAAETMPRLLTRTSVELFWPSLAAWLTSVIGFAVVAVSPVHVLRDFAVLGTFSLVGAWLATLFVLPAMLMLFPPRRVAAMEEFAIRFNIAGAIGSFILLRAKLLLTISCVTVALLCGALAAKGIHYQIESDPMILHPQPSLPLQAQRRINDRMQVAGGSLIVYLQAESQRQLLERAYDVQQRLDSDSTRQVGLASTFGLPALLPDPRVTESRRSALQTIAPTLSEALRAALARSDFRIDAFDQYAKFITSLASPGPAPLPDVLAKYPDFGQLLLPRDVDEREPASAVTLLFTKKPLETREDRESALSAVRSALAGLDGVTVTGTAAIGHDLESAMRRDLPRFVLIGLALIAGYLVIHFRSVKLAAMALLPIAISLLCVIACISFLDLKLNLLHTVMAPLLLGINLDYGIFAVHAWHDSRDAHDLTHHFPAAFAGLLICGGSTIIGFGSLVVTSIPAVEALGWLINVGVISCIAATLLLLWSAMMLSRRAA